MNKKILVTLILGMFLLSFASADYKFQNDGGTNLVRIHSENGNLSVLGNVSAPYFVGSGKYLTDIETDPAVINYWKKNMHDELYYNDANVGIGTNDPSSKLEVNGTLGLLNENELSSSLVTLDSYSSHGLKVQNSEGYVNIAPLNGGWAHIYTDRNNFIFNKPVYTIGGKFASHSTADLILSAGGSQKSLVIDNPTGNVGIGTDNPSSKLDVVGGINATGVVNADDVCVDGTCLSDVGAGNVNASDSELLDGYDSSFFMPLNKSVTGDFDFNGGWTDGGVSIVDGNVYAQSGYFYDINSLQVSTLTVNGSMIPPAGFDNQFDLGSGSLRWRDGFFGRDVDIGGNVGIGTTNPKAKLEIKGGHTTTKLRLYAETGQTGKNNNSILSLWASEPGMDYYGAGIGENINGHPHYGVVNGERKGAALRFVDGSFIFERYSGQGVRSESMKIDSDGNVGIGDTNPDGSLKLDVEGPIGATQYCDNNGQNCQTINQIMDGGKWNISGSNLYPKDLNLKVGIGTTSPDAKLNVKTSPGFNRALKIGPETVNEGDGAYIEFTSSSTDGYGAQIGGLRAGAGKGDLVIRTGGNNQQERMRVTNDGDVEVKKKLIVGNSEISTMTNGDVNVW